MDLLQLEGAIQDLRTATEQLLPAANADRFDVDRIEHAVAHREKMVIRLTGLVERDPDSFTQSHLEQLRTIHSQGKLALERLLTVRQQGWITATRLNRNAHVLKTFSQFSPSSDPPESLG